MNEIEQLREIIEDQAESMRLATEVLDRSTRLLQGMARLKGNWRDRARLLCDEGNTYAAAMMFELADELEAEVRASANTAGESST